MEAYKYDEIQQNVLNRFLDEAPSKPYCSNNKTASLIRTLRHATHYDYIQHNKPISVAWITLDLDHKNLFIWEDINLPTPNLIVIDPVKKTSHVSYAIHPVYTGENARPGPIRYLDAVTRGLAKKFQADLDYVGLITKNPLSKVWKIITPTDYIYDLGELSDYVTLESKPWGDKVELEDPRGRNCTLFNYLRYWAYKQVISARDTLSLKEWEANCLDRAESYNHFNEPLPYKELQTVARSIAKWTWHNYQPVNKGVMGLMDSGLSLREKQSLSAKRTNENKKQNSEKAIQRAIEEMAREGIKPTQAAVAKRLSRSRQHLNKHYKHLFKKTEEVIPKPVNLREILRVGIKQNSCRFRCISDISRREALDRKVLNRKLSTERGIDFLRRCQVRSELNDRQDE